MGTTAYIVIPSEDWRADSELVHPHDLEVRGDTREIRSPRQGGLLQCREDSSLARQFQ